MSKIINFPGKVEQKPGKVLADPQNKLYTGPLTFTCPHCSTQTEANFTKMVFRSLDFYCGDCGTYYKLTNPAFTAPVPRKPK